MTSYRATPGAAIDWSTKSDRQRTTKLNALLRAVQNLSPEAPEREIQRLGDGLAAVYGYLVHHNPDSRRVQPGLPDSLYLHKTLLCVEYKSRLGTLRPEQSTWIIKLAAVAPGAVVPVIVRPADMPKLAEALRLRGDWRPQPKPKMLSLLSLSQTSREEPKPCPEPTEPLPLT